ncbi:uncharacterized protein G2W53_039616 [Senna tora]|uniref:Uncharacterized protein n=1 Tax=Senna tora TaxID=362788 RepID=A0A834W304_9FABA|nr:uncharacterized protein G2W53_039616 [Senna tora]
MEIISKRREHKHIGICHGEPLRSRTILDKPPSSKKSRMMHSEPLARIQS